MSPLKINLYGSRTHFFCGTLQQLVTKVQISPAIFIVFLLMLHISLSLNFYQKLRKNREHEASCLSHVGEFVTIVLV